MPVPDETIQSRTFRLINPGDIRETFVIRSIDQGKVVVEPRLASICHADLRYYTGQRKPEILAKKLPMALLHEGIGIVMDSGNTEHRQGGRVVIVPNIPDYLWNGDSPENCCDSCRSGLENYCLNGRFLSSGFDGLAQNRLVIPADCAIPIPDDVPDEIAVLSELCSVSYQALNRVRDKLKNSAAAVFGDGPVGYLTAAMLHHVFGMEKEQLHVFGAIPEKLNQFAFAECALVDRYDFTTNRKVDIAIDCTGGRFSEEAIHQSIHMLRPGGILILLGVSEDRVPVNTRDILEKGLTLMGSSRSEFRDYYPVLEAMRNPEYQADLRKLLPEHSDKISSVSEFAAAMDAAAEKREWRKVILDFQWKE